MGAKRWVAAGAMVGLLWLLCGHAAFTASAAAQSPASGRAARLSHGGLGLHLFRPAVDSRGHLSVDGTEILGHLDYSFGLILDAGFGMVPYHGFKTDSRVAASDAQRVSRLVDEGITGTLRFNLGLVDWLVVGLQLPISFFHGPNVQVPGVYNDPSAGAPRGLSQQGVGDLTLHAKARLVRFHGERGVGLAAILRAELPTGNAHAFTGEPGVVLWPSLVFEARPHPRVRLSLEGGYRAVLGDGVVFPVDGRSDPGATTATDPTVVRAGHVVHYDDAITFGVGASFRVAPVLDLIAELYGAQIARDIGTRGALSMEALGGFKVFVHDKSYLMFGAGAGIPVGGLQSADIRGTLAFVFEPGSGDRDGDGIADAYDKCPDQPEDRDGFQDSDGCPDLDNDGDGIADIDDACPDEPGDADHGGCPVAKAGGDRDGDGIADAYDKCPDQPEDRDGYQDEDGCPDPDNDGDGIADVRDLCPNEPEDFDGFQDEDGCPDPDNDGDRIPDKVDKCPNEPETYNGYQDDDGCPDKGRVIVTSDSVKILDKIHFDTDSARIQERSDPILDAVAATLIGNPGLLKIEVQGHADERGSDRHNLDLTRRRAEAVVEALVRRGVARDRLRSAGYGERCPVDPSHTAAAWEKNRRVEFKILETEDGPTGVEVTCKAARGLVPKDDRP